ncbi:MAG: radical SAM protein [Desulfovibrio sp.]|nr:radical SAM protein [Desulfovibrio sp.]
MKTVSARFFSLTLPWVVPRQQGHTLIPLFIPFSGCPVRCVFCAQDVQTGLAACMDAATPAAAAPVLPASTLANLLDQARENLESRSARGLPPAELAFYGGTFTAMPLPEQSACLDLAQEALERGWIHSFRCSTRPDCVDAPVLARLRAAGCGCVELGVQSFANEALVASKRGYDGKTALRACALVKEAGLTLGVQLLPGMPGHTPAEFLDDVPLALAAGADMLRFYPCLVLEGTALARMWRQGLYSPWGLEDTLNCLARGWLLAQKAGVPVIRMGLAPEASLDAAVLAGPVDAALGSRVMARALLLAVRQQLEQMPAASTAAPAPTVAAQPVLRALCVPPSCQGYVWGLRGELRLAWANLGLPPGGLTFDPACGQTLRLTVAI